MKLRVRVQKPLRATVALDLEGDAPRLSDLHTSALVKLGLEGDLSKTDASFISLNGTEPVTDSEDAMTLNDLGIVGGDLVFVVIKDAYLSNHASSPQHNDQLPSAKTEPTAAPSLPSETADSANSAPMDDSESTNLAAENFFQDVEALSPGEVNQYLRKTMLIRDSLNPDDIPDSLRSLLEKLPTENAHDVLFVVINVLMTETGFDLKNSDEGPFPEGWKTSNVYRLHYSHPDVDKQTFEIVAMKMGSLPESDDEKCQIKVKVDDFITIGDSGPKFHNLSKLSREFKDGLSYALLHKATKGGSTVPSLSSLFVELKMLILQKLDAQSLCQLSRTCRMFNDLSNTGSLWYRLFLRDWGKSKSEGTALDRDWKKLYKQRHFRMLRIREMMQQATKVVPPFASQPYPSMFRPPPWAPQPPFGIGGDYDRNPGFPVDPFRADGRFGPFPPRPRFDPFGPLPDHHFQPRMGGARGRGRGGIPRPFFGGMRPFF